MQFQVGDRVRIVSRWPSGAGQNDCGEMDHWLGKTMTIRRVNSLYNTYKMVEDQGEFVGEGWNWFERMIVGKVDDNIVIAGNTIHVITNKCPAFKNRKIGVSYIELQE